MVDQTLPNFVGIVVFKLKSLNMAGQVNELCIESQLYKQDQVLKKSITQDTRNLIQIFDRMIYRLYQHRILHPCLTVKDFLSIT